MNNALYSTSKNFYCLCKEKHSNKFVVEEIKTAVFVCNIFISQEFHQHIISSVFREENSNGNIFISSLIWILSASNLQWQENMTKWEQQIVLLCLK